MVSDLEIGWLNHYEARLEWNNSAIATKFKENIVNSSIFYIKPRSPKRVQIEIIMCFIPFSLHLKRIFHSLVAVKHVYADMFMHIYVVIVM